MSGTSESVFISYAREDSKAASRLYEDLKRAGLRPWLDEEDLLGGQDWDLEIRKAVRKSKYFIALFSSASVQKRGYVQKEYQFSLEVLGEFVEGKIFAIPVRLDDCEIPYEKFKRLHRVDLFPDWSQGIKKLLRTFGIIDKNPLELSGEEKETWRRSKYPSRLTASDRDEIEKWGIRVGDDGISLNEVKLPAQRTAQRSAAPLREVTTGSSKVYVCYSRRDAGDLAERIYDYLKDAGYDVFIDLDQNTIRAGGVWSTVIDENISKCNLFVVIITPFALRSSQVEKEVSQAVREKKRIIPVIHKYVSKKDVKWGLGQFQGINFEDKYELARKLYIIPSLAKN